MTLSKKHIITVIVLLFVIVFLCITYYPRSYDFSTVIHGKDGTENKLSFEITVNRRIFDNDIITGTASFGNMKYYLYPYIGDDVEYSDVSGIVSIIENKDWGTQAYSGFVLGVFDEEQFESRNKDIGFLHFTPSHNDIQLTLNNIIYHGKISEMSYN